MTYRDSIERGMKCLSRHKKTVFLGEGIINAGRVYGTLNKVPVRKCIEMPIAENLIMGAAIGLAIGGYKPIVVFQRMDFMLIAADALINHAALIPKMSGGKIQVPLIVRCIIGSQDPRFDVGEQHKHDFQHVFEPYIHTIRIKKENAFEIKDIYEGVYQQDDPHIVIEEKDLYEKEIIS